MPLEHPLLTTIIPTLFYEMTPEYSVTKSPDFVDGSCDFNINHATAKVRRWRVDYFLTAEQAATLDAFVESTAYSDDVGSGLSFNFTPRGGTLIAGVRYDRGGYERHPHEKTWIQRRSETLIKRP
jgi:hypothetical protein